jgi:excisionase family DNA binding protein
METLTFDQLPKAVGELLEKVSRIEDILSHESINPEDAGSLFSIQQASVFLNLSTSTIYGKVCRREIPVSKQGKRLYFNKIELLEWIKAGRKKTLVEIQESIRLLPKKKVGKQDYNSLGGGTTQLYNEG